MESDRQLSQFQQDCEAAVVAALGTVGSKVSGRELLGKNETYVLATIEHSDIVLYIYEDEAEIHHRNGRVVILEAQDYSSSDELSRAFVSFVLAAVGNQLPSN